MNTDRKHQLLLLLPRAGFQPARGPSAARTNDLDRAGSAGFQPARGPSPRLNRRLEAGAPRPDQPRKNAWHQRWVRKVTGEITEEVPPSLPRLWPDRKGRRDACAPPPSMDR